MSWSPTLSPTIEIKTWCSSLVSLVLVNQLCPTLCNPMDCSSPVSSVHGILQARILEWIAVPCSRRSSIPTQGLNSCFPHCRQILYHLTHQGSPVFLIRIVEASNDSRWWEKKDKRREQVFVAAFAVITIVSQLPYRSASGAPICSKDT